MVIRADDRVSNVLARNASLIDVFIALSPAFGRLRAPGMRKVMTRLVTVRQAARMGEVDLEILLARLNNHMDGNNAVNEGEQPVNSSLPAADAKPSTRPATLDHIAADQLVTIDVREELRAGREPFSLIMAAHRNVPEGGALCVRATFEPVPLYAVMLRHGLTNWTERRADDDWLVWFYPAMASDSPPPVTDAQTAAVPDEPIADNVVVLDVRGLEPPEPMMRTLSALEQLPEGATLVQINVRVPQFLLPLLEERGFVYDVREQDKDLVRLFIRRSTNTSI